MPYCESDGNVCQICYVDLETSSYVMFKNSSHETCTFCANEIIFRENPLSPFDGTECERVIYFKCRNQQQMDLSLHDYRLDMVRDENGMRPLIESMWSASFRTSAQLLNQFSISKKHMKEIMESSASKEFGSVPPEDRDKLQRLHLHLERSLKTFSLDLASNENKPSIINHTTRIDKIMNELLPSSLQELLFINTYIQMISNPMVFESLTENTFNSILRQVQNDIDSLERMSQYARALVITEVEDNKDLYASIINTEHPVHGNKCLICYSPVDVIDFAKFQQCRHKICLECVKTFGIHRASCPYENGATHLMVYTNLRVKETVTEYFQLKEVQLELEVCLIDTVILLISHWNRLKPVIEVIHSHQHQTGLHTKEEMIDILRDLTDSTSLGWIDEGLVYDFDWKIYFYQRTMINRSIHRDDHTMSKVLDLANYILDCINLYRMEMRDLLKVENTLSIGKVVPDGSSFEKRTDIPDYRYEFVMDYLKNHVNSGPSSLASLVDCAEEVYFLAPI